MSFMNEMGPVDFPSLIISASLSWGWRNIAFPLLFTHMKVTSIDAMARWLRLTNQTDASVASYVHRISLFPSDNMDQERITDLWGKLPRMPNVHNIYRNASPIDLYHFPQLNSLTITEDDIVKEHYSANLMCKSLSLASLSVVGAIPAIGASFGCPVGSLGLQKCTGCLHSITSQFSHCLEALYLSSSVYSWMKRELWLY